MLKASELREKPASELSEMLENAKKELMGVNLQVAAGGLKDRSIVHKKKKDIARILTVLNEKSPSTELGVKDKRGK